MLWIEKRKSLVFFKDDKMAFAIHLSYIMWRITEWSRLFSLRIFNIYINNFILVQCGAPNCWVSWGGAFFLFKVICLCNSHILDAKVREKFRDSSCLETRIFQRIANHFATSQKPPRNWLLHRNALKYFRRTWKPHRNPWQLYRIVLKTHLEHISKCIATPGNHTGNGIVML